MTERVGLIAELDMTRFNANYRTYITSVQKMNSETLKSVTGINKSLTGLGTASLSANTHARTLSTTLATLGIGVASRLLAIGTTITTSLVNSFKNAAAAALGFGNYLNNTLLTTIKRVGLAAGIAAIAMIKMGKDPVSASAEVEAQLSRVQAVIGLTKDQAVFLKEAVMELGIDPRLVVTTKEAADIMEVLAKNGIFAGKSLQEMEEIALSTGRAIVYLANSTGADFALATDIATDVMLMFNKEAKDMEEVVAGIIGVTVNSKFTIHDYELALRNGGAAAASFGVALEDFNTIVALTAEETGRGRRAGTGFANMMYRLVPISDAAAATMKELGIITADGANRFFDAQGNMQDFSKVVSVLNETFEQTRTAILEVSSLTPQQQTLLKDLKVEYANAEKVIDEYTNGVKSLTASEEVRNKKIGEAQAIIESITPKIQELSAVESEWIEKVIEMSDAQEIHALRTIFGRDALASVIGVMKEGAPLLDQFASRGEAVSEVINMIGVSQEEANKMLDEGVTYFDLMRIRLEQIDPEEMARIRMDNLKGSIEILSSIIETLWIKIGDRLIPIITELVRKVSDWLSNNKELQAWLEGVSAGFGTLIESLAGGKGLFDSVIAAFETVSGVTTGLLEKDALAILAGDMSEFAERGEDVARAMLNQRGMSEEYNNLQTSIASVRDKMQELADKVINAKAKFDEFTGPIVAFYNEHSEPLQAALKAILILMGGLMIASAVASALALIVSPVGLIVAAVGTLAFAWNENWGGMQEKVYEAKDALLSFLEEVGVMQSFELGGFKQVWEDLPKIFSKISESSGLTGWFDKLKVKMEPVMVIVRAISKTLLPAFKEAWIDIVASYENQVKPMFEQLKETFERFKPLLEILGAVFLGIQAVILGVMVSIVAAVAGAVNTLITGLSWFIDGIAQIAEGIYSVLEGIFNVFASFDWLGDQGGMDVEQFKQGILGIFGGLFEILQGIAVAVVGLITATLGSLVDMVWSFVKAIIDYFKNLYNELVGNSIIPDMVLAIIQWFIKLITDIPAMIIQFVITVLLWIFDLYRKFVAYIIDLVTTVVDRIGKFVQKFIDKIIELKDSVVEKVKEMWADFVEKVEENVLDILKKIAKFVLDMIKALEDKKQEFFDAGANIIDGIIDGIKSKLVAGLEAIKDFGQSLWDAWTGFWQEKSPSKLMMSSAQNIMEGANIGFKQSVPVVSQTLENAATSLFSSFLNRTNDILPFSGNSNPVQNINNTSTRNITLNNNFSGSPQITDANQLELLLAGY